MVKYWLFVAKEVLKNFNEVPWNDSGTEAILPNTKGQDHFAFRAFKTSKSNLNTTRSKIGSQ